MRIRHWKGRTAFGLLLVASLVVPQVAFAGDGGAGSGGEAPGTGSGGAISWTYNEDYGSPTDDNVRLALSDTGHGKGISITSSTGADAVNALHTATVLALQECQSRWAARHQGSIEGSGCRLVGVGAVHTEGRYTGHTGNFNKQKWMQAYQDSGIPSTTYYYKNKPYQTSATFTNSADSINSLVDREASKQPAIIVLVLASDEPPVDYNLSISTTQQGGFSIAGGTEPVHDSIVTSNDTGTAETVTASVWLNWDAPNAQLSAKTASRTMSLSSIGSAQSPNFVPADFGWNRWAAGTYWFDIHVDKQGNMAKTVDTTDRESSEKWRSTPPAPRKELTNLSGKILSVEEKQAAAMPYYAKISALTAGAETMTFTDTVFTKDVVFGAKTADVLDDDSTIWAELDGKKIPVKVSIDDSSPEQRVLTVTAEAMSHDLVGDITLYVLTSPRASAADFKQKDEARACWDGGFCQTSGHKETTKVTPQPNKVWVLDTEGGLETSDDEWTNSKGSDGKTFLPGDPISAVVNGSIPAHLSENLDTYFIADDWSDAAKYVDFSKSDVTKVFIDGEDVSNDFEISVQGTVTVATAKEAFLKTTKALTAEKSVKLILSGTMRDDYATAGKLIGNITNKGSEQWNTNERPTNIPGIFTWTPAPDKVWVAKDESGKWKSAIDPNRSNQQGADNSTFLDGDTVAALVNGMVPANLAQAPQSLVFTDDFSDVNYVVDLLPTSQIRVMQKDVESTDHSSVTDILSSGDDITHYFTISQEGTTVSIEANDEYRETLVNLTKGRQLSILIPFVVDFAEGKGAAQVRKDFGKNDGDEISFCTTSDGNTHLTNTATETISSAIVATNSPGICGYVPPAKKQVLSEASQGGEQKDIDTKIVSRGQKVEYKLTTSPQLPESLAYTINSVQIVDTFDAFVIPDKQTVEVTDLESGEVIDKTVYSTVWDDSGHAFTLTFADAYVQQKWVKGSHPRLKIRFEATVSNDAPLTKTVDNQWMLKLNNSLTPSNKVVNRPEDPEPVKEVSRKEEAISIDGRLALLDDVLWYRVTLDAADLKDEAYKVQRLGLIDDYDDDYLEVLKDEIRIIGVSDGFDYTDKVNVEVNDGKVYAFFKTVDTLIPTTGETIPGDPQPVDLKTYSDKKLNPLQHASIDQTVLGQNYQMILPVKVKKVTDGYTVINQATQITNSHSKQTNVVNNPLKEINPHKDVRVRVSGESKDGGMIGLNSAFVYQLDSSEEPPNRAYEEITCWSVSDDYDETHDRFTGKWAVYAQHDILERDGTTVLYQQGDKVTVEGAQQPTVAEREAGVTQSEQPVYFVLSERDGVIEVKASAEYLSLASANNSAPQSWSLFLQMIRVATGSVINSFDETINEVLRQSNEVTTVTPENSPGIDLEKFDGADMQIGDRDSTEQALETQNEETPITFRITNTGNQVLHHLELVDKTVEGSGSVGELKYPENWDTLELKPGESVDVTGTFSGLERGSSHTNIAQVSGIPRQPCPVIDNDPFAMNQKASGRTSEANEWCDGEPLTDSDAWNARSSHSPVLAETGSNIAVAFLAAAVLLGFGTVMSVAGSRHARHGKTSLTKMH